MASRHVCWTLNNFKKEEVEAIKQWNYKYIVFGIETGEEGTPHLQGYVEWGNPKRFSTMKNLNPRIHWEKRHGTAKQAANYCKKDGVFFEAGEISNQGKRTDLDDVADMVLAKWETSAIAREHPKTYIKYHKGIDRLKYVLMEDRVEPPNVEWLWGKSGTGKTYSATTRGGSYYIKDNSIWWDGYEQQDTIVIDDFDQDQWNYRDLLRLLDRYAYQGQVKGGYVKINSPNIIITCEFAPKDMWTGNKLRQVMRRVTDVTEVVGNTNATTS